jgi:tetratricopeptide (TPR) repeat protein
MSNYLRGFVCIKTGRTDEAINTLSRKPRGSEYSSFVYLDYLMGQAKLNKLEPDADVYLKRFVSLFKGKNLLKDAYKKLSWSYIVQGDTAKYLVYRGLSKKYGVAQSDEDKNAQKEAESGLLPNIYLLKARLLFDGGYYTKAEHEIRTLTMASLQSEYRLAEYYYRYGRILHESNKYSKAIEMYSKCIATPGSSGLYFAPSSCLQLGYIYEKLGFKELAKIHFEKALSYRGYEYRSSVSQKAKAALSRIN